MSQAVNQQPTTASVNQDSNDLDRDGWSNGNETPHKTAEPQTREPTTSFSGGLDFTPGGWLE